MDDLQRRDITLQQFEGDLVTARKQYREAVEENGRLEAKIQSYVINAQSEQDILSGEVSILGCFLSKIYISPCCFGNVYGTFS